MIRCCVDAAPLQQGSAGSGTLRRGTAISIRQRLGLALVGLLSISYGILLVNSELVIRRDRLQRHERLVMATAESIAAHLKNHPKPLFVNTAEGERELQLLLNDFSATRVMVWLSRPGQPPLFPKAYSVKGFFTDPELLVNAGINAPGMQKPRSFNYNGETYFTCSMPLPDQQGVLRFLEDVGISPASRKDNLLLLFVIWLALVVVSAVVIDALLRLAIRPLTRLEEALDTVSLNPAGDVAGSEVVASAQPAELKGIVEAYNRLADRLQQAWSQQHLFISAISHELLTPMALITSSSRRLLRRSQNLDPSERELLASIQEESGRVDRLVRDLLDLARGDSGKLSIRDEPFQPVEVLKQLRHDIQALPWGSRVQIDDRLSAGASPDTLWVSGDQDRFRQCVLNVLENAVKYSPEGTPIQLAIELVGSSLLVQVNDQGPGIPVEERERVFEPFYRTADARRGATGSGVGLAVVRLLIERMHGSVAVVDGLQPGGCFQFTLPLLAERPSAGAA